MPSRVAKTVLIYGGYPHREHRSKKGRKKRVFAEQKPPAYPVYLNNDEQILKKNEKFNVKEKPTEFKEIFTLGDALEIPEEPVIRPLHRYPKLVCENCGHHNQLQFDPIEDPGQLKAVQCNKCKESAYFQFYWKQSQLSTFISFMSYAWLRELIKLGKQTFLSLKQLYGKYKREGKMPR